jgi:hypothetical protein
MAKLIKADGITLEIRPKNGTDYQLEELQKYVDGYIDIINLRNGSLMVVNDDGKGRFPTNLKATQIAHENGAIWIGDWIDGDVVMCNNSEIL